MCLLARSGRHGGKRILSGLPGYQGRAAGLCPLFEPLTRGEKTRGNALPREVVGRRGTLSPATCGEGGEQSEREGSFFVYHSAASTIGAGEKSSGKCIIALITG